MNIDQEIEKIRQDRTLYLGSSQWHHDVNQAVYWAPGWENWQRFRLSLKGTPIHIKLAWLDEYLRRSDHSNNEYIRVYNYLGALLRGGFEEARPMYNRVAKGGYDGAY